jgi:hypothetical protein
MNVLKAHGRTAVVTVKRSDLGMLMEGIAAVLGESHTDFMDISDPVQRERFRAIALRIRSDLWAISDAVTGDPVARRR